MSTPKKKKRGTAAMSKENRLRVASLGGKSVSKDIEHMSEIGRKGGTKVSQNRVWMAEIGRRGGKTPRTSVKEDSL